MVKHGNTTEKGILAVQARWARYRALDPVILGFREWLRFWSKVEKGPSCWNWMGKHRVFGYGVFSIGRDYIFAHRWAYEHCVGPIPKGLTIDHLCRNTRCVNPKHLEVVTRVENTMRGFSPHAICARRTHCLRGNHPLSGQNLYINPRGQRECRTCRNEANERAAQKRLGES
jgi:hypothetical protein